VSGAGENVDAMERVPWVPHIDLVLFTPFVEGGEVQDDVVGTRRA